VYVCEKNELIIGEKLTFSGTDNLYWLHASRKTIELCLFWNVYFGSFVHIIWLYM